MPPDAVKESALLVQESMVVFGLETTATFGVLVFCVMVVEDVVLQPLEPVTVTVYVPSDVTLSVAFDPTILFPLLQE
jgi:hypothetical protein